MKTYACLLPLLFTTTTFAFPTTYETTTVGSKTTLGTTEGEFTTTCFGVTRTASPSRFAPASYATHHLLHRTTTLTTFTR